MLFNDIQEVRTIIEDNAKVLKSQVELKQAKMSLRLSSVIQQSKGTYCQ